MMKNILLFIFSIATLVLKAQTIPGSETIVFSEHYTGETVIDGTVIGTDKGLSHCTIRFDKAKNKNKGAYPTFSKELIYLSYGNTITVTGKNHNITKIKIVFDSENNNIETNYILLNSGKYTLSKTEATWSGNDKSVIFTIDPRTGQQRKNILIKSMTISYGENKQNSNISFGEQSSFSIFENEIFDLPPLSKPDDYTGNILFTSSDKDVADIDSNGNIIVVAPGKTTITAAASTTDVYNSSSSSLNLQVKRIVPAGNILYESFNNYDGEGGNDGFWGGTLFNGEYPFETDNTGWTCTDNDTQYGYKCAIIGRSIYNTNKTASMTTPSISFSGNKSFIIKFRAAAWVSTQEGTTLTINAKGLFSNTVALKKGVFTDYSLKVTNPTVETINHQISFTGEAGSRFFIDDIYLIDPYISVSPARYTVYVAPMDIDFTKTPGITAYKAISTSASGVKLEKVTSAPAKTPLIIEADAGTYELKEAETAVDAITNNLLLPANGEICGNGKTIYGLSNKAGYVGFYKVKEGVKIPTGKAYIILDNADIQAIDYMPFIGGATGIHSIGIKTESDNSFYDLQGCRVLHPRKGIYIHNGKKIIF